MLVDERRESPDIGGRNCVSVGSQVTQDCIHVACVPEHDRIDDEAQTSRRPVEENTGPLGAQRGSGVEPAKELERLGWIARGSVAVPLLDLAGVLSMGGRALGLARIDHR